MTEYSWPFDGSGNALALAAVARMDRRYRSDGWCYEIGNGLAVSANTPNAMNVLVATGGVFVQGYGHLNDAVKTVTIEAAHATLARYDLIIVELDPLTDKELVVTVLKGTAAASPSYPALTQTVDDTYQYAIAAVHVTAGASAISASNITDLRDNVTYCGRSTGWMGGITNVAGRLTGLVDPSGAQDAATKNYVDTALTSASFLFFKQACVAATTGNITIATALNNGDQIDGVTLATGNRVLVKDQSTASQNGVYVVGASPARAADFDASSEILGAHIPVIGGTVNANTVWKVTNTAAITVGSTSIVISQWAGPPMTVTAGGIYHGGWNVDAGGAICSTATSYLIVNDGSLGPCRFYVTAPGTIRVVWDMKASSGTFYVTVYKNGAGAGTEKSTASSSFSTQTDDITVAAGDYLELYYKTSAGGAGAVRYMKLGVASYNQLQFVGYTNVT